ncbi:hypothetical protein ACIBCT_20950 [Streptosporangium sp. NPDC050855]|uniref:hypothetical protein n=1 Tax=Streptosporangium sp. NPDC050855 TaxID=3366194 RepID=UPI00378A1938
MTATFTPTEIVAEIARLSALLSDAITKGNEDATWDGDIAALLGHFATAQRNQGAALNVISDMEMEDDDWGTVVYETDRSAALLSITARNLANAQTAAQTVQNSIAAAIETAQTSRFATIYAETRPSGFFATLAALPNSAA